MERTTGTTSARTLIAAVAATLGVSLLGLNLLGLLLFDLRSNELDGYQDFAGSVTTPYMDALSRLDGLPDDDPERLATEATRIFHDGMAHLSPDDFELIGVGPLRMTVPAWENWVLFLLAHLKPDTYRDYEFCDYRRALKRGAGRCGQQTLALVDFLSGRGLKTGFVNLGGHTLATAEVNGRWILLDPDYGGVIPFDLSQAESDPNSVIPFYWNDQVKTRRMYELFNPQGNDLSLGGPEARWGRACAIEPLAYALKWLMPLLLVSVGWFLSPGALQHLRRH